MVNVKALVPLAAPLFLWPGLQCSEAFTLSTRKKSTPPMTSTSLNADLITFDLDDTIFPVSPVVRDANSALISHLHDIGYDTITQESLIASTKYIRTQLLQEENKVITYTELRKRAICLEMNKQRRQESRNKNEYTFTDVIVCQAYDIWEYNRHLAAERYLYHDATQMLQNLKEQYPNAIIGAITNGKGNPLKMERTIHEYFDFCISGEDENVFPHRKPHEEIYFKSLDCYRNLVTAQRNGNEKDVCWVHVGDDLANDVGASAKCGALAVWAELSSEEYNQSTSEGPRADKGNINNQEDGNKKNISQPFWSTATKEEIERRRKLNDESLKYVSAKIERLSDLPTTIRNITAKV